MMNDVPRQTLRELVQRYGPGLCSDTRRCEGLLRDLCGEHRREINILVSALKERVPLDLLAAQSAMPRQMLLKRLARRLEDQLALTGEAALWAVDSWALALGVVTDAEVEERERESRERVATPPATARPAPEETVEPEGPADTSNARAPVTPPPQQQTPHQQTPHQQGRQTPPAPPPAAPRPRSTRRPSPPTTFPPNVGGPAVIRQRPSAGPLGTAQAPAHPNAGAPQDNSLRPAAKKRGGRRRGCLIGCLLFVLLSAVLFLVVPFVVSVLREEQQRRSNENPPARSQ